MSAHSIVGRHKTRHRSACAVPSLFPITGPSVELLPLRLPPLRLLPLMPLLNEAQNARRTG